MYFASGGKTCKKSNVKVIVKQVCAEKDKVFFATLISSIWYLSFRTVE